MSQSTTATQQAPAGVFETVYKVATSSLGAKWIMAITGILLVGFIVAHLAGNLQMFSGSSEAMNAYAKLLHAVPELLWVARIGLITISFLHIWSGLRLAAINRAARPVEYAKKNWRQASLASRVMPLSGLTVLAFFIFHLGHFTTGWWAPKFAELDTEGRHNAYGMVVAGFSNPLVVIFYTVGLALLGMHLSHGIWSATQTMGFNGKKATPAIKNYGLIASLLLMAGFIAIPVAVFAGIIK